jgi:hypothetical protein
VGPGARAFNHDSRRASEHGGHPLIYADTMKCEESSRCCTGASARTGVRRGYGEGMQVRRLYVREWTNRSKRLAFDTAPAWTRVRTAGFAVECLRGREQSVGLSKAGGDGSDINPSPKSSRFQIFQSSRARPRRSHADPPRLVSEFALRGFRYDSKLDLASVHVACADRRHITTLHQTPWLRHVGITCEKMAAASADVAPGIHSGICVCGGSATWSRAVDTKITRHVATWK